MHTFWEAGGGRLLSRMDCTSICRSLTSVAGYKNHTLHFRKRGMFALFHFHSEFQTQLHTTIVYTLEGLRKFETVMQTRDEVAGLHNCREFSQRLECLCQVMQTQKKKVFYCFYKITLPRKNAKLLFVWH